MAPERLIRALIERGRDDWVMAAELAWIVRDVGGASSEDEVRAQSISALAAVLGDGLMRIGDVTNGGFLPWKARTEDALARVEASWRALGRPPDLGEVFWLENTEQGDALAEHPDDVDRLYDPGKDA